MSRTTAKCLNQIANGLERFAQGIVGGIELVVSDLASTKRSRRRSATKKVTTKQTRKYSRRQQVPVVIIKIVKEEQ